MTRTPSRVDHGAGDVQGRIDTLKRLTVLLASRYGFVGADLQLATVYSAVLLQPAGAIHDVT